MKKKIILILGIILLIITGCNKQTTEEDTKSNEEIFKEYFSEITGLNNYETNEYANFQDYALITNDYQGGLSAILYDDKALEFYIDNQDIKVKVLEIKDKEVTEVKEETIYQIATGCDELTLNLYTINDDTSKFYLEFNGYSTIFTDGKDFRVIPISYNNSELTIEEGVETSYSGLLEEQVTELIQKVENLGLTYNDITKTAYEQTENTKEYFRIERNHLSNFDLTSSWNSNSKSLNYGTTTFKITNGNIFKTSTEEESTYNDSYIGEYTYTDDNDIYKLILVKEQDSITYYLNYYQNDSAYASEELWGTWNTSNKVENIDNQNTDSKAEYSFEEVNYLDNAIEIKIKVKSINNETYKDYIIKEGTYKFTKDN